MEIPSPIPVIGSPAGIEGTIKSVKSVRFSYTATERIQAVLQTFRKMVNEAIAISLRENVYGRLRLRDRIYKEFQARYGVVSCFPYSVAEVAWSIVKKHNRWSRKPFARRLMMKLDVQNYSLNHSILSIPFKRDERILIPLKYGDYQRSFLSETTLKRGSVTITESAVIIAFTKITRVACPSSRLGIDLNERSIVCSDGGRFDLSEVSRLHTEYGIRRRTFYRKYPHDRRLKAKFASSSRERNRVRQFLHRAAKAVVEVAAKNSQAIVLEKLSGIRYAHHKGNGEGEGQRRRIAQWPFRLFQSFVLYKGAWSGVQVEFVSALRTSQICNKCGKVNTHLRLTEREWRCPNCGASLDRDLNAAINIERRGAIACLGEVRPGAQDRDEAMKGNEATTAPILRVEALKLARLYFSVEHVEPEGD